MIITENCQMNREEVFVLSNGKESISIWEGDEVSLLLTDESKYQGCVGWSIEPLYLTLGEKKEGITNNYNFAWRNIREIDILKYSLKRPDDQKQGDKAKFDNNRKEV